MKILTIVKTTLILMVTWRIVSRVIDTITHFIKFWRSVWVSLAITSDCSLITRFSADDLSVLYYSSLWICPNLPLFLNPCKSTRDIDYLLVEIWLEPTMLDYLVVLSSSMPTWPPIPWSSCLQTHNDWQNIARNRNLILWLSVVSTIWCFDLAGYHRYTSSRCGISPWSSQRSQVLD